MATLQCPISAFGDRIVTFPMLQPGLRVHRTRNNEHYLRGQQKKKNYICIKKFYYNINNAILNST